MIPITLFNMWMEGSSMPLIRSVPRACRRPMWELLARVASPPVLTRPLHDVPWPTPSHAAAGSEGPLAGTTTQTLIEPSHCQGHRP